MVRTAKAHPVAEVVNRALGRKVEAMARPSGGPSQMYQIISGTAKGPAKQPARKAAASKAASAGASVTAAV
jgi:hypothetical protein